MEMCLIHPALGISNVTVKAQEKKAGDRRASLDRFSASQLESHEGKRPLIHRLPLTVPKLRTL